MLLSTTTGEDARRGGEAREVGKEQEPPSVALAIELGVWQF